MPAPGAAPTNSRVRLPPGSPYRWLSPTVLLAVLAFIVAASLAPADENDSPWLVRVWKTSDGLAGNYISGVAETADGFLWTVAGAELARFDGVNFQRFSTDEFARLPGRKIRDFVRLRNGDLVFVLTDGAVARAHAGQIELSYPDLPEGKARLESLAEDPAGGLFLVFSDESVWRLRDNHAAQLTAEDGLPAGSHCRFAVDTAGRVWFSKGGNVGLLRGARFETLHTFPSAAYPRVAAARNGGVWIGVGPRLLRTDDGQSLQEIGQLPKDIPSRPTVLLEDRSGAVWFGTYASGLFRFDGAQCTSVPVSHRVIVSLTEDREGSVWVGTSGGGLNQIQPRTLTVEGGETGVPYAAVQAMCEDPAGHLWGITQNGLLVARSEDGWKKALPDNVSLNGVVSCIAADATGALWIGTKSHRLHCWQDGKLTTWSTDDGIASSLVRTLLVSSKGDLWIGGSSPARVQRLRAGRLHTFDLPVKIDAVRALTEDATGQIWVATTGRGLLRIATDDRVSDEARRLAPVNDGVRTLQATPDGSVWIGFDHAGVGRIKGESFGQITTKQGLLEDHLELVLPDRRGWIWFAANQALFKVSEQELAAVAEGRATHVQSIPYGRDQGLRPVFGETVGALRRSDGRLWIPTATSLVIINPEAPPHDTSPAPVLLTRVKVDDRVVAAYGGIVPAPGGVELGRTALRLPPDHRRLDLDFAALSFRTPANVQFRYRLDPFDDRWIEAGTRRTQSYSRLAAGDYHFRVKASNSDGVWNDVGATLAFTVEPYFWATWWFRATVLATFTALVFATTRYISFRRLRGRLRAAEQETALERERARIARDIHDDLGSRLTKIVLLSGLITRDRAAPEKAGERVLEITETARQLIKSLDETVWAVNPRNDTLPHLVNYLGQYAVNFLRTAEVACRLELPDDPPQRAVSSEIRHHLFLAVKEALTNVVRHARATEASLRVTVGDNTLEVVITDNGRGFTPAPGEVEPEADGLRNLRQRMAQLGGACRIESAPGAGTTIVLRVPCPARP